MLANYLKRLEDLEAIAKSFAGVEKSYAIQAGREIRIIVDYQKIGDDAATLRKAQADFLRRKTESEAKLEPIAAALDTLLQREPRDAWRFHAKVVAPNQVEVEAIDAPGVAAQHPVDRPFGEQRLEVVVHGLR